jgi:hypothetical protein
MTPYRFAFSSSYQDVAEFTVEGDGLPYRVSLRRSADESWREYTSYTPERWAAEIVPLEWALVRAQGGCAHPIAYPVLAAFRDWYAREYGDAGPRWAAQAIFSDGQFIRWDFWPPKHSADPRA